MNLVFGSLDLIFNFFSAVPILPLILLVGPSPNTKKYFCDNQYEMINYLQYQKLQHF